MRQAARRAWRIGQPRDCYIYYMYYQGTMQHRAMSLMSRKMAAALALEGEFSEEGLAAMAGEGDEQMALAKSMSEKIDDADMQRSWQKVKSLNEKKKPPKKKAVATLADLAADEPPSELDELTAEAQLLARTILERQGKPVPEEAKADIISLADSFAEADEEPEPEFHVAECVEEMAAAHPDIVELFAEHHDALVADAAELVGKFTVMDGDGNVLAEAENKIVTTGVNDVLQVTFDEPVQCTGDTVVKAEYTLKVHQPEPERKVHAVFEDIEFDDALLAKMMANIAANGMTLSDLGG
jgi:hypothetical protein